MGFGQMFLEFYPIDIGRIGIAIQIPPVTAREEHVFLVRGDPRPDFIIFGVYSRTHTMRFCPGIIGSSQGEVKVRWCSTPCSRFNGVENQEGSIRGNARMAGIEVAHVHGELYRLLPFIVHKRSYQKATSSGFKAETVIRCHRESTHGRVEGWS